MAGVSPVLRARLAGVFYVLTGGTAFAVLVRGKVIVGGDAAATAHNILAAEGLYRLGLAADIVGVASYAVVTVLLYGLLRPVNPSLALLAAFFSLVGVATQAVSSVADFVPLIVLGGAHYLAVFDAGQLQAVALTSLQIHGVGFGVALVFFGFYCALLGYLIFASSFFPRILGVLVSIAGLALLTNSFTTFLAPEFAHAVAPVMLGLDGLGELSLMLWLLVIGVNGAKWEATASRRILPSS